MSKYANEYASALMDLLIEIQKVDEAYNEFKVIVGSFSSNPELINLVKNPLISKDEKKALIEQIFSNIKETLKHFLFVLIDYNRLQNIAEIYEAFCNIYDEYNNILPVTVVTTVELTESQKTKIKGQLELKYRKKVNLKNTIDSKILGGIQFIINDKVIEYTISNQLKQLKSYILNQN